MIVVAEVVKVIVYIRVVILVEKFISWVSTLYQWLGSCVTKNRKSSEFFRLGRRIRQGCPLSAFLFILVAEIFATATRTVKIIKGITIHCIEFKLSQLSDDTTLQLKDMSSLRNALAMTEKFSFCSSSKLNRDKTEVVPINNDITTLLGVT